MYALHLTSHIVSLELQFFGRNYFLQLGIVYHRSVRLVAVVFVFPILTFRARYECLLLERFHICQIDRLSDGVRVEFPVCVHLLLWHNLAVKIYVRFLRQRR